MCIATEAFPHTGCAGSPGCCTPFCDLTDGMGPDNPTCLALTADAPGIECISVYPEGEAVEGYEHVGLCATPS